MLQEIEKHPVIPVFYHDDAAYCREILEACYAGGVRIFEFVNRGKYAAENFKSLKTFAEKQYPDLRLGIGTIKNKEEAQQFISLGADFIVSPIFDPQIAEYCVQNDIFWIPGCMTPTEVSNAEKSGAKLVKIFPGDTLGPNYIKAIRPLFPSLKFMPTGGVDLQEANISAWLDAGVFSLGLGSKLFQSLPDSKQERRDVLIDRLELLFSWISTNTHKKRS